MSNVPADFEIIQKDGMSQLQPVDKKRGGAIYIDFEQSFLAFQKEQIGIKQDIAKAVGCKKDVRPDILDATAGLAGDASLLAYLGCKVSLVEQNSAIYCLLKDATERLDQSSNATFQALAQQLQLLPQQNAIDYLQSSTAQHSVIYLDPMFPERQKSAKVKKEMQYLHQIAGIASTQQEQLLLDLALSRASKRVVVKRPRLAPFLAKQKPTHQIIGKTIRFDVYMR